MWIWHDRGNFFEIQLHLALPYLRHWKGKKATKSSDNPIVALSSQLNSHILLSVAVKLTSRLWKRLIATTKPCDVHTAKQAHVGCPLLWAAISFFPHTVVITRGSWKWLPRRAVSDWWRLTALLICDMALFNLSTCASQHQKDGNYLYLCTVLADCHCHPRSSSCQTAVILLSHGVELLFFFFPLHTFIFTVPLRKYCRCRPLTSVCFEEC